jgi:tRNA 2-thiouridine synthesizing protein A
MKTVDARGLACPEPVLRARRAIQEMPSGESVEILVETVTSRENVLRTIRSLNCTASVEETGEGFRLIVRKP